jgi:hypothetical protein
MFLAANANNEAEETPEQGSRPRFVIENQARVRGFSGTEESAMTGVCEPCDPS